jgi:RNA polymerase sigma-70 factor (ECF subfamily)
MDTLPTSAHALRTHARMAVPALTANRTTGEAGAGDLRSGIPAVLPSLGARALRLARSRADADDLVQETVLRALRFENTFQRGTNLRAWMHQILESVFVTRCPRRARPGRPRCRP